MKQFIILESFIDMVEGNTCKKGDIFQVGELTNEDRLEKLSSNDNVQGRPMIEEVKIEAVEEEEEVKTRKGDK